MFADLEFANDYRSENRYHGYLSASFYVSIDSLSTGTCK